MQATMKTCDTCGLPRTRGWNGGQRLPGARLCLVCWTAQIMRTLPGKDSRRRRMDLLEQATLVARAIHTLEWLRDNGAVQKETTADDWCRQSWCDLNRLQQHYREQGVSMRDIDLGQFVSFDVELPQ